MVVAREPPSVVGKVPLSKLDWLNVSPRAFALRPQGGFVAIALQAGRVAFCHELLRRACRWSLVASPGGPARFVA
jgi:hypothetical protein